ncbi:MAG: hypothetical protein GC162_10775 [Planctomycetes bacterium]|nr:hypothetical protein [Planctomycetota bacterium]
MIRHNPIPTEPGQPLFERIGGSPTFDAAWMVLARLIQTDESLVMLRAHAPGAARVLLETALQVPADVCDGQLHDVFSEAVAAGFGDSAYNALLCHLVDALGETDVDPLLCTEAYGRAAGMRAAVLGR